MAKSNILPDLLLRGRNRRRNASILRMEAPDGFVESTWIVLGGIEQWVTIRGESRANPILLFVHGGPGATYSVFSPMLRAWERHFTVVQWDQRGSGKTLRRNGKEGSGPITFEQIARDGIELARLLGRKLGQQKVILIGSSAGSLTGLLMAARSPELFHAYVGTDQNSPGTLSESHQVALEATRSAGMKKGVQLLERMGPVPSRWTLEDFDQRNRLLTKVPQAVPEMVMDLMLPALLTSPEHGIGDVIDVFKGMGFSMENLFQEMVSFDFGRFGNRFQLPFFILQGDSDLLTPPASAKSWLDGLEAPQKEFVTIKNAGHLACFSRPDQFLEELLQRVRPLACPPSTNSN